jgi:hypothetical protein
MGPVHNQYTCYWAAKIGHLEVLKYAFEHGCPWDDTNVVFFVAAQGGHLNVLKWALSHGFMFDEDTFLRAKNLGLLMYWNGPQRMACCP